MAVWRRVCGRGWGGDRGAEAASPFCAKELGLQVSNGAVAMAKTTLEQLLMRCATPLKDEERAEEIVAAQEKSFHHVTHDLVREVTSPNSTVRKQAMHSLQVLAQVTGKSVTVIMEPHKEVRFLSPELE